MPFSQDPLMIRAGRMKLMEAEQEAPAHDPSFNDLSMISLTIASSAVVGVPVFITKQNGQSQTG